MGKKRTAIYSIIIIVISLTVIVALNLHNGNRSNKNNKLSQKRETSIEYIYEKTDKSDVRLLKKEEISHINLKDENLTLYFQGVYESKNHITYSLEGNNDEADLKVYVPNNKTSDEKTISKDISAPYLSDLKKLKIYIEK
ncbi:hypothetical protein [Lactococcus lactis]|uniref:hypothetical protein n=1 Tax=Lactococcus lactis TaxID=1358 RepID=UPI0028BF16B1|nr:hypothetical protein [Lactococcus lactis]WNN69092.1 hypothetical protein RIN59_03230 [Lactococcus lactis]WPK08172.1 hypothetical protein R6U80_08130 [Lactococcus lactis]